MGDSSETNCLFVGDLSIFTSEDMLTKVFSPYGVIDHVKVIRCEATHKNLSYGFVRFVDVASAAKAKQEQDGRILCGRPMRIRWASSKSPYGDESNKNTEYEKPQDNSVRPETASVHVSYTTECVDSVVTEEQLLEAFSKYGKVADVIIKKYEIDPMHVRQSGYAFVHYLADDKGIDAALASVQELQDKVVGPIQYKCSISHKLQGLLRQKGRVFSMPMQNKAKPTVAYKASGPAAYARTSPGATNPAPVATAANVFMPTTHMMAPPAAMGPYSNGPLMMCPVYLYDQQTGTPVYCVPRLVNNNGTYVTYLAPASPTSMQGAAVGYSNMQQPMMNTGFTYQQAYMQSPSPSGMYAYNSSNPTSSDTATMVYEAEYHQEPYGAYSPIYTNNSNICVVSPSLSDGEEQANITNVDDQRYAEMPFGYAPNSAFERLGKTGARGSSAFKRETYADKVSGMHSSK
eukprot:gene28153-33994_t